MTNPDFLIIGGGIVGLTLAYTISQKYPYKSILIIEKEKEIAQHQSSHNSGVLHTGIYYPSGSAKAVNCINGKRLMEKFCRKEKIEYKTCGKIIVAKSDSEEFSKFCANGLENKIKYEILSRSELHKLEPYVDANIALYLPKAGVIDFKTVCRRLADLLNYEYNQNVWTDTKVTNIRRKANKLIVETAQGIEIYPKYIINCAGLYSDDIAKTNKVRIIPFRGEYFKLTPEASKFCNSLIYPVPDHRFPFLGIHLTRKLNGDVICGPNAVLAFAKEGYNKGDINLRELYRSMAFSGLRKLMLKHWKVGLDELWCSWNKKAFVKRLQELIPDIKSEHLVPYPAGVRAQAVGWNGELINDFLFKQEDKILHVVNSPSPAATASFSIANRIVQTMG